MKTKLIQIFKKSSYWLSVVTLGIILGLSIQFAKAWTEPTDTPPDGNVEAPINVGDNIQYKAGTLGIGKVLHGYSNAVFDGNVGIGTTAPQRKLDVRGHIRQDTNDSYDIWIQGAGTDGGRNLALMGYKSTDTLYLNYNGEYAGGTYIGGSARIGTDLTVGTGLTLGGVRRTTWPIGQIASTYAEAKVDQTVDQKSTVQANCPTGYTITGGSCVYDYPYRGELYVTKSRPNGNGWFCEGHNHAGGIMTLVATAVCTRINY